MKKIFSINPNLGTWRLYSQYLAWIDEKINSWTSYLQYFKPTYNILNESMSFVNVLNNTTEKTDPIDDPAWEYSIWTVDENNEPVLWKTVHCYFPAQLYYRQGYLNTHGDSYLCYFYAPNTFDPLTPKTVQQITKTEWEQKVSNKEIVDFPPSRVVFSRFWRHAGVQHAGNKEAFNPDNYMLVSKSSSLWYVPVAGLGQVSWNFTPNAAEVTGLIVPFNFELSASRYIYLETVNGESNTDKWDWKHSSPMIFSATWFGSSPTYKLFSLTKDKKNQSPWTGNHPIIHSLKYDEEKTDTGVRHIEEFIADDFFDSGSINVSNRLTSFYQIRTPYTQTEIHETSVWSKVRISIC